MRELCRSWRLSALNNITMNYKTLLTKPALALAAIAALGGGAGVAAIASADTATASAAPSTQDAPTAGQAAGHPMFAGPHGGMHHGRGAMGTVTAVNVNTITITNEDGSTATIDAENATVSKMVTEPVSSIEVGERIGAEGQVSGTTITAKHIMAGIPAPSTTQTSQ